MERNTRIGGYVLCSGAIVGFISFCLYYGRGQRDEAGNIIADEFTGSFFAPFYRIANSFKLWRDVSSWRKSPDQFSFSTSSSQLVSSSSPTRFQLHTSSRNTRSSSNSRTFSFIPSGPTRLDIGSWSVQPSTTSLTSSDIRTSRSSSTHPSRWWRRRRSSTVLTRSRESCTSCSETAPNTWTDITSKIFQSWIVIFPRSSTSTSTPNPDSWTRKTCCGYQNGEETWMTRVLSIWPNFWKVSF